MALENTSFIHFNDIYNVEKAPRFVGSIKKAQTSLKEKHTFTFFSGDAFSPSSMSTILRGEQMIPVLNSLNIDAACLGNHDLDFGLAEFKDLAKQCNFPWICSNAYENEQTPLGECSEYLIIDKGNDSPKILVIGLVETGWLDTLSTMDADDIAFEKPVDYVNRRIPELSREYGPFDAIVALTHMRMNMDYAVAENGGVDIILGGHDHHYEDAVVNDIRVLNSATDFKAYTIVDVVGRKGDSGAMETVARRVDITSEDAPDDELAEIIKGFDELVNEGMDAVIGQTKVRLDARSVAVRTGETNMANFLAEVVARATSADVAIVQSGSIRADRFIEKGDITARDVNDLFPKDDEMVVIEITGEKLLLALENGVSKYPATEGRFPCVDGVRFTFDPKQLPGNRVVPGSVYVRGCSIAPRRQTGCKWNNTLVPDDSKAKTNGTNETNLDFRPLDLKAKYSVASTKYLAKGKDGYDEAFDGATWLHDGETFPPLPTIIRNIFTELGVLKFWSGLTVQGSVVNAASAFKRSIRRSVANPYAICPKVDGRVTMLTDAE